MQRFLLACGILAALLYLTMMSVIRYQGYSAIDQTVSELSAWGVSTRSLWLVFGTLFEVLIVAFGLGVWASAKDKRSLRAAGAMLFAYGAIGAVAWPFASMHRREVLAAGGSTAADSGHLLLVAIGTVLILAAMVFTAAASGRKFRWYTGVTVLLLLVFGLATTSGMSDVEQNLPTPWLGVWERVNIWVTMLWLIVFACSRLRAVSSAARAGSTTPTDLGEDEPEQG